MRSVLTNLSVQILRAPEHLCFVRESEDRAKSGRRP